MYLLSTAMFNIKLGAFAVIVFLSAISSLNVYSQARNSIGICGGLNLPMESGGKIGRDRVLQANLFAHKRFAIMPVLGIEDIKSKQRSDFSIGFLNMAAKYYACKNLFVYAGPSCYVGGNDGGIIGLGGTAGVGYDWAFDRYSSLEISARTDFLPAYLNINPLAGLRVAYKFNFSKKSNGKYRVPENDDRMP